MSATLATLLQQPPPKVDYFFVYVAESEFSKTGYWIQLEPDKSLSLVSLRAYFPTCFGIKHKLVVTTTGNNNAAGTDNSRIEVRYVRYHNGFFRFPAGLDLNNTRFVAYYYGDEEDIGKFMEMVDGNDENVASGGGGGVAVGGGVSAVALGIAPQLPPVSDGNKDDSSLLGRTVDLFHMDSILQRGAQSTPVKEGGTARVVPPVRENVSSTSDLILNEPTVEVITVKDTQSSTVQFSLPPPPENAVPTTPSTSTSSSSTGIKAKLGPSVSSTSDEVRRIKRERITINDSSGFQRERSSVMVAVNAVSKSRNMLDRYQQTRPAPEDVHTKTPLKVTFKGRGRQVQRDSKIVKIEDGKGRTTALLTKKKWSETAAAATQARGQKRRSESGDELDEERHEKRFRYNNNHFRQNNYYQRPETKLFAAAAKDDPQQINVLLVGFHNQRPINHETIKYFSDFGVVTNFTVSPQVNQHAATEYYAFMKIHTKDALSLFSDRHLYNGAIIYAIRVDGKRPPLKLTCKLCGYYGLNVGYLHYHVEGQCHQHHLMKCLQARAADLGNKVYLDSYYRISGEELYVQYPASNVQEVVRPNNWKRCHQPATYSTGAEPRSDYRNYYADNRERYY